MKSKRIVVTGSRGFVASHTIPLLKDHGYVIVNYDIKDGQDICNKQTLKKHLSEGCKVLHLAAVARFADCDKDPSEAYRTNVGGTATVLTAAAEAGAERVVLASTGSVYMPVWQVPITEYHPVCGNSHYGMSKALGESMIGLHQAPFVVLRYAHLYGTGKWHGGLIDSFIARIDRGMRPILYGGWQSNDFCYIKDIAQANLLALETPHVNEIFNVGSGQEVTTREAYDLLCSMTGYKGDAMQEALRPVDAPRFVFNLQKARRLLKYNPRWGFTEGLRDLFKEQENKGQC